MKVSKHLHSCLFIEESNKTILIDPGNFTYTENALDINRIEKLDFLLITHEHPDHFSLPFIKALVARFPKMKIMSVPAVVSLLSQANIYSSSDDTPDVQFELITHERLWDKEPPQNAVFTIFHKLTHPGDSIHFAKTAEILALPIQAPWGSTNASVEKALLLQPKVIIPIHDSMWKDDIRKAMYARLSEFFKTKGIDFKSAETGESISL